MGGQAGGRGRVLGWEVWAALLAGLLVAGAAGQPQASSPGLRTRGGRRPPGPGAPGPGCRGPALGTEAWGRGHAANSWGGHRRYVPPASTHRPEACGWWQVASRPGGGRPEHAVPAPRRRPAGPCARPTTPAPAHRVQHRGRCCSWCAGRTGGPPVRRAGCGRAAAATACGARGGAAARAALQARHQPRSASTPAPGRQPRQVLHLPRLRA